MYGNGTIAIGESVISYDNIDNYSWEYVYKHWCSYIVPLFFYEYIQGASMDYSGIYNREGDFGDPIQAMDFIVNSPLGVFIDFMGTGKAEKDQSKRILYSLNSFLFHIDTHKLITEILYEWPLSSTKTESAGHLWKYFYNPDAALAFILDGAGGDSNPALVSSLERMSPVSYYSIPSGDSALKFFGALLSELLPTWKGWNDETIDMVDNYPESFIKHTIEKYTSDGVDDWVSFYKNVLIPASKEQNYNSADSALRYTYYVLWPFILLLLWPYFMHIFSFNYYIDRTNFDVDKIDLQTRIDYGDLGQVFWNGKLSSTTKQFQDNDPGGGKYYQSKNLEKLLKYKWWWDSEYGYSEMGFHYVFGNDLAAQMKWPPSEYFRYFREYVPNYDYWGSLITGIPRAYSRYDTDIFNGVDQDDSNNCWQVI